MTASRQTPTGTLSVVGTGPGALDLMAPRARRALENAEVVVGYRTYLDLVRDRSDHAPRPAGCRAS